MKGAKSNPFISMAGDERILNRLKEHGLYAHMRDTQISVPLWMQALKEGYWNWGASNGSVAVAAILKYESIHGHLPSAQGPVHLRETEEIALDGAEIPQTQVFAYSGGQEVLSFNFEATADWSGGWEKHMSTTEQGDSTYHLGYYGLSRTNTLQRLATPIGVVRWLDMDNDPQFMETLHRSVGVMHNMVGLNKESQDSRVFHSGAELGALLLYVFGDDMTRDERLMVMTTVIIANNGFAKIGPWTWLDAIDFLAPPPRILPASLHGPGREKRGHR